MIIVPQKYIYKYIHALFLSIFVGSILYARPPINIFYPSDRPLQPYNWSNNRWQLGVGYEGSLNVKGFQPEEDCSCEEVSKQCVNVLQIWQDAQNAVGMLYGLDPQSPGGSCLQLFNQSGNNGVIGRFTPTADLKIPYNILISARYYTCYNLIFGIFLPVLSAELSNVCFAPCGSQFFPDNVFTCDVLQNVQKLGCLKLGPWKRSGVGDLLGQVMWVQDFPQAKPWLKNVRLQTRLGLSAPTGKEADEDLLLAFPFGNNGSWAIQLAAGIDLVYGSWMRCGVDAEFLYLFGNIRCRRIRTDINQTDLLFLTKRNTFTRYGLNQQYNLFLELFPHLRGLYFRIDYQYLTQNEDRLYPYSDKFDPRVVNSSESLQDWSTHSFIFQLNYDCYHEFYGKPFAPYFSLFYKKGFNGKRALLADTLGFQVTLNF